MCMWGHHTYLHDSKAMATVAEVYRGLCGLDSNVMVN